MIVVLLAVALHIKAASEALDQGKKAERSHEFSTAIDCFETAIEIEPTYSEAFAALVQVDLEAGRKMQAASALTRWLQIEPNRVRERVRLGNILLDAGETERALAQYSLALKVQASDADALAGFATAARKLNLSDAASDASERGRKLHPADARFKTSQKP